MSDQEQWLADRLEYAERQIELLTEARDTMGALWANEKQARHAAEAKLAKAVEALKKAQSYITDLEEHEGAEGFSRSTVVAMGEYYDALTELEQTE
jgi:hypothetical protein